MDTYFMRAPDRWSTSTYAAWMRSVGWIVICVLLVAGCGSGEGEKASPTPSPSPDLLSLADACVQVNQAAEETIQDSRGLANPQALYDFGMALEAIAERTDERGSDAVTDLATRSYSVSDTLAASTKPSDRLDAGLDMLNGYKRLQDSCQAVGAPLSVPGSS